eukprot:364793-Chlamydomonas_euryale.AAC.2
MQHPHGRGCGDESVSTSTGLRVCRTNARVSGLGVRAPASDSLRRHTNWAKCKKTQQLRRPLEGSRLEVCSNPHTPLPVPPAPGAPPPARPAPAETRAAHAPSRPRRTAAPACTAASQLSLSLFWRRQQRSAAEYPRPPVTVPCVGSRGS